MLPYRVNAKIDPDSKSLGKRHIKVHVAPIPTATIAATNATIAQPNAADAVASTHRSQKSSYDLAEVLRRNSIMGAAAASSQQHRSIREPNARELRRLEAEEAKRAAKKESIVPVSSKSCCRVS